MKHKKLKLPKITPSSFYTVIVLLGFGVGYFTNEFLPMFGPVPAQQTYYNSVQACSNCKKPTVCFTPNKQCQVQLIQHINRAQKSIYVQAYSFTDREVTDALVKATKRGVLVKVLLDKSNRNDKRSAKDMISKNNIPLRFDHPAGIAHNKVIIIDQSKIITGSYNFSSAAYKRNTENLLVINDNYLAQQYIQNWIKRWDISKEGTNSNGQSS